MFVLSVRVGGETGHMDEDGGIGGGIDAGEGEVVAVFMGLEEEDGLVADGEGEVVEGGGDAVALVCAVVVEGGVFCFGADVAVTKEVEGHLPEGFLV